MDHCELRGASHSLRHVLNVMFPQAYIELYHLAPNSVCSLFSLSQFVGSHSSSANQEISDVFSSLQQDLKQQQQQQQVGNSTGRRQKQRKRLEASSEPSSRVRVVQLNEQLNSSLVEHQAKATGLCPIRRAIYDQCFDELIRQVTVNCMEQGLLLFRIRNELRMTINAHRRAYESGVKFGLNKAIQAQLELEQKRSKIDQLESLAEKRHRDLYMMNDLNKMEQTNKLETFDKIREYFESELAKKEQIILQQRNIIKALTQKYTNDIINP